MRCRKTLNCVFSPGFLKSFKAGLTHYTHTHTHIKIHTNGCIFAAFDAENENGPEDCCHRNRFSKCLSHQLQPCNWLFCFVGRHEAQRGVLIKGWQNAMSICVLKWKSTEGSPWAVHLWKGWQIICILKDDSEIYIWDAGLWGSDLLCVCTAWVKPTNELGT